eukprot:scaffold927_cov230-Pinguiococcus_pyrenoidosus.AAC.14
MCAVNSRLKAFCRAWTVKSLISTSSVLCSLSPPAPCVVYWLLSCCAKAKACILADVAAPAPALGLHQRCRGRWRPTGSARPVRVPHDPLLPRQRGAGQDDLVPIRGLRSQPRLQPRLVYILGCVAKAQLDLRLLSLHVLKPLRLGLLAAVEGEALASEAAGGLLRLARGHLGLESIRHGLQLGGNLLIGLL